MSTGTVTVREISSRLRDAGIDGAIHEALLLAEKFTGRSPALLRASVDTPLPDSAEFSGAVEQRCARYPLQYILGSWEFMGLPFHVGENCLIPRSDTEILCEYIIEHGKKGGRLLDLCTGSGCIPLAVLHYRPDMIADAVELYPETIRMAERNSDTLALSHRLHLITGDATEDLFPGDVFFNVISANPPYITAEEMDTLAPELSAEPRHALTDEGDGLSLLRAIIHQYKNHLSPDGFMILEHGSTQSDAVCAIAREAGLTATPLKDYGGNTRAAVLRV